MIFKVSYLLCLSIRISDTYITFRLIKECDLQLYEGGPLSFSSESQTEETSFEY